MAPRSCSGRSRLQHGASLLRPKVCSNGFLSQRFVDGCPLTRGFSDEALASTMANYLNFLSDTFQVERRPPFEELLEMIEVNVREGLGDRWLALLDPLPAKRRMIEDSTAVAIDGRMLPHEWLANVDGYLKTDALDHHDDHFFPGCQDIAWDVAGAIIEFEWDAAQQQCFLTRIDATLRRLPFYRIAYAAFRLGYAVQSAKTLESSPEALRFHRLAAYYRHTLQSRITTGGVMSEQRVVCVDLDGVLNLFDGWKGADYFHPPRPGAEHFLRWLWEHDFRIVIFTVRWPEHVEAWLRQHGLKRYVHEVTDKKPPGTRLH